MNLKSNLKNIWAAFAVLSFALLVYLWLGNESPNLLNAIIALDGVLLLLSLPCGLFAMPVMFAAWYVLEMEPSSIEGVYLETILLLLLGAVQWFWLRNFWYPREPIFQKMNLT